MEHSIKNIRVISRTPSKILRKALSTLTYIRAHKTVLSKLKWFTRFEFAFLSLSIVAALFTELFEGLYADVKNG